MVDVKDSDISKSSYKDAKIKFKHLVDYYLTSGSDFGKILRSIDSDNICSVLLSGASSQKSSRAQLLEEADNQDGFNEKLLKVMCVN